MLYNDKIEGWIVLCNCNAGQVDFHTSSYLGGSRECEDCGGMGFNYAMPEDFEDELVITYDGLTGYAAHCEDCIILYDEEGESMGEFEVSDIASLAR